MTRSYIKKDQSLNVTPSSIFAKNSCATAGLWTLTTVPKRRAAFWAKWAISSRWRQDGGDTIPSLFPPPSHTITITFDIHTFGTSTTWSNMSNGTTLFGIKAGRSVVLSQTIRTFKLPIADLLLRFSTWLSFSSMASLRLSSNSSWFLILNSFGHCSTECGLP